LEAATADPQHVSTNSIPDRSTLPTVPSAATDDAEDDDDDDDDDSEE